MRYAKIQGNNIQKIGIIRELFPNVSFPTEGVDVEFLNENSVVEVVDWVNFNPDLEKLEIIPPYIFENKVYAVQVTVKTKEEISEYNAQIIAAKETEIRIQRNQLLKDSDWTQVADAPVDKVAWATYRQALRDITGQAGFPNDVTFPNPPL